MTIVREGFSEEMLEIVFEHVESGSHYMLRHLFD